MSEPRVIEKPLLLYHNDLDSRRELIEGRLLLIDVHLGIIADTFIATSGLPGYQSVNQQNLKGKGTIPVPSLAGIPRYRVTTNPISMRLVKGVEGDFFKIDPHGVKVQGVDRGDFGIHRDANAPGSAGCIVVRNFAAWEVFRQWMQRLDAHGLNEVPLLVSYS